MAFTSPFTYETEAQEAARLAESPAGSDNHDMSSLPVMIPRITLGMLIERPRRDGVRIIGVVTNINSTLRRGFGSAEEPLQRSSGIDVLVVHSTHDSYPPGQGITFSEPEARRSRLIDASTL